MPRNGICRVPGFKFFLVRGGLRTPFCQPQPPPCHCENLWRTLLGIYDFQKESKFYPPLGLNALGPSQGCLSIILYLNKSNTECGIIRPTNAIYKESNSLLRSKALSKCEVNPTSRFQDIAFTSNKLLWRPSWFS